MEQIQEQTLQDPFQSLDAAAKATTTALTQANIRHGFIGGYATSLIGGGRITRDIDLIVDADPGHARNVLLQAHSGFTLSRANSLVFTGEAENVAVELLRGGSDRQLKLPNAHSVPILSVTGNDNTRNLGNTSIPIVAPPVLVITKIKRWSFLAESTRPKSMTKAWTDFQDIKVLLDWLSRNKLYVDFEGYAEKPKEELLPGARKLYQMHAEIRPLLEVTLDAETFALISS